MTVQRTLVSNPTYVPVHMKDDPLCTTGMIPLTREPSLYMKENGSNTAGLLGAYVDDCLLAGNIDYQKLTEQMLEKFDSRPREWDNEEFLGVRIETITGEMGNLFEISQPEFLQSLKILPEDASFEKFASVRAAVAWLAHSRPDISCAINKAGQVTKQEYDLKHIKGLNQAIKYVKETSDLKLKFDALDTVSSHLRVYVDASFTSNSGNSSQIGYIIFLCDADDKCHVLPYSSRKSRRVVRSIMAGEVYAFSAGFDHAFMIKHDLETIYNRRIPMTMLTDSKQMFDVITRASYTTERRLMIDIAGAREAYKRHEVSNVGLVISEVNLADSLTKPTFSKRLGMVSRTRSDRTPLQQWIVRLNAHN